MKEAKFEDLERAARRGDAKARQRWALEAWRRGLRSEALDSLVDLYALGADDAGAEGLALLGSLGPEARRSQCPALLRLLALGAQEAWGLLAEAFASLRRIRGSAPEELRDFIARNALSRGPLRLYGSSDRDQALVALALHELRGVPGFLGLRNVACPGVEEGFVEEMVTGESWGTVFVYHLSPSHGNRLSELVDICDQESVRLIYGARQDLGDGDHFAPAPYPEIELPELTEPMKPEGSELFVELIRDMTGLRIEPGAETRGLLNQPGLDFERLFFAACRSTLRVLGQGSSWEAAIWRCFRHGDVLAFEALFDPYLVDD